MHGITIPYDMIHAVNSSGHGTRERGGAAAVNSGWAGNLSETRWRQLLTTLSHNRYLVETPG